MKILIDNGHGIQTKGKRSPDGKLLEYAYTRELARQIPAGYPLNPKTTKHTSLHFKAFYWVDARFVLAENRDKAQGNAQGSTGRIFFVPCRFRVQPGFFVGPKKGSGRTNCA